MRIRHLGAPVCIGVALALVSSANAQISMSGNFVKLAFNNTGDLISPLNASGQKQEFPDATGILFRKTLSDPFKEIIAWKPDPAETWVLGIGDTHIRNGRLVECRLGCNAASGLTDTDLSTATVQKHSFDMDLAAVAGGPPVIHLQQIVSYGVDQQRVRFDISLTNLTTITLPGLSYLRTVNPKQGVDPLSGPGTFFTDTRLNSPFFNEGIAADSIVPGLDESNENQRHIGLGSEIVHTRVNAVGNAATNFNAADLSTVGSCELVGFKPDGTPDISCTPDSDSPFLDTNPDGSPVALNLWFDNSVIGDLGAGDTKMIGTFFYIFGGGRTPPGVPEPGALALLGGLLSGAAFAFRRLRR